MVYLCMNIGHFELSKIAQSGHTVPEHDVVDDGVAKGM